MPALNIAASPVAVAPKGPTNGPAGAGANTTDPESGNPFAAVLGEQMNGAAIPASDGGMNSEPTAADSSTEPAADGLAALLPVLMGVSGSAAGQQASRDESTADGATTQAELALAMLTPAVASAADTPATGDGAAVSFRGRGAAMGPIAGRPGESVPAQPGATDSPAIVAAAADGSLPRSMTDAPTAPAPAKGDAATLATSMAGDKARDVSGADRIMPEQAMAPMHAAAASRHAGTDSHYQITPALGSRQWETAVGNSLVFMTGQQHSSAELVLTPPQLGRIEISLTVNSNNEATATFISASPAVQEALTNAVPRLKEILADAGITLSQADVNAGSPEQSPGRNGEPPRRPATADFGGELAPRTLDGSTWSRTGHALVDVFA